MNIEFTVADQAADLFSPFSFESFSGISQPFWVRIEMVSERGDLQDRDFLNREAAFTVHMNGRTRTVNAMIVEFEQLDAAAHGSYLYRVTLGPRLLRLKNSVNSQIYGTTEPVSVLDVIEILLTASRVGGPMQGVAGRLGTDDYEIRTIQDYPKRDYVVQYNESDFDFLTRLTEHWGICYYFEQVDGRDVVVFGDDDVGYKQVSEGAELAYQPASGLVSPDNRTVTSFRSWSRPLPRKVLLRDYYSEMPHLSLYAEAVVDPKGHGTVYLHGDHFRTNEEGQMLATVRAEELLCQGVAFHGESTAGFISPGHMFTLTDHFRSDFNRPYVVTEVRHSASIALPEVPDAVSRPYSNRFVCIPETIPLDPPRETNFRPPRRTPKPVVAGVMNAMIDASSSDNRGEMSTSGHYRIRQPMDLRGEDDGNSSHYLRKMEPYGGSSSGMHCPLVKGTEVLIACVNGDPDRPIILGTVPNPRNPSVVTSTNSTTNRIRTTSGITMQFKDGAATSQSASALPAMLSPKSSWTAES